MKGGEVKGVAGSKVSDAGGYCIADTKNHPLITATELSMLFSSKSCLAIIMCSTSRFSDAPGRLFAHRLSPLRLIADASQRRWA
jgi:hypothetical protein